MALSMRRGQPGRKHVGGVRPRRNPGEPYSYSPTPQPRVGQRRAGTVTPLDLLWLFLIVSSLQPLLQQRVLALQRTQAIRSLERRNGSRVITLIHRREGFAFLGVPFGSYIDIDDSEAVIRAIEMTDDTVPIDVVLHTPGGLVLAAEQIAAALAHHPATVTVHVPHYAMSGGTLIALAADAIVVSPSAVLGPVDPQVGELPVASSLAAVERKNVNEVDDRTLILADAGHARALGLRVPTELPNEVRHLMRLYPQPRGRRPSVEYIPSPYELPTRAPRGPVPARPKR